MIDVQITTVHITIVPLCCIIMLVLLFLDEEMITIEQQKQHQQEQRERSLSPDSLEQRLFKQQMIPNDG